jgi:dTDP-4-amino-4,6-dideoxygalactose transaminase
VAIVEDCSHAHGAAYQGKAIGSWGDVGCFSLQGAKAVSAGEGGIAVCSEARYVDRMLALGQPVRGNSGPKVEQYDLGNVNVGPKYRPHLFGVLLAQSSLRRLPELNRLRSRSWDLLCSELAGCEQLRPVETLPQAQRGGFLEFKLILGDGGLRVGRDEFLEALCAEGVPASADRYGFLHEMAVFRQLRPATIDSLLNPAEHMSPRCELPSTESLRDRIVTLPAFANVSQAYLKQVAAAIRKVARAYATNH